MAEKKTIKKRGGKTVAARRAGKRTKAGGSQKTAQDEGLSLSEEHTQASPETNCSAAELEEFHQLLLTKRAELVGDVKHMTHDALRASEASGPGSLAKVPMHLADAGSDNWEQDFTLDLIENERQLLKEIDAALVRVHDRTYGICQATHEPISMQRLRAKPWALYCIEYARQKELGQSP